MTSYVSPTPDSSDDLIARARAGDQAAWSELFEQCYPKMLRVIRRRLDREMRQQFDSTDIANEVMNSLALRFGDFDFASVGDMRKFMLHAAQQRVVDKRRYLGAEKRDSGRTRSFAIGDGSTTWEPADSAPTASKYAIAFETEQHLLDAQSGAAREVTEYFLQGDTNSEVSSKTGWPLRTVQRFRKALKDIWLQ